MIIGITGSFGTGKSTVAKFFKELGAEVIDADKITHELIKPRGRLYKRIVRLFGKEILAGSGAIERTRLARVVFSNTECLKRLCKIMHPRIIKEIKRRVKHRDAVIVIDAPLLIEAGLGNFVDKVLVVKTTRQTQFLRCRKKGFDNDQIKARINAQMPLKDKLKSADFVVCNEGSLSQTKKQVKDIFKQLR